MKIKITGLLAGVLIGLLCSAQQVGSFELSPNDFEGITTISSRTYGADELWEYINGGADIYLEYGFRSVLAQEAEWQGSLFRVDAYQMEDPLSSFGIFSIMKTSCVGTLAGARLSCYNQYQVQFATGNFYVSVVPLSSKQGDTEKALKIATTLTAKSNHIEIAMPHYMTKHNARPENTKLITGQLGMQNGAPQFEKAFGGLSNYKLWVSTFALNGNETTILHGIFTSERDKERALSGLSERFAVSLLEESETMFTIRIK